MKISKLHRPFTSGISAAKDSNANANTTISRKLETKQISNINQKFLQYPSTKESRK